MSEGEPLIFVRGGALGDFVITLPVLAACFATGRAVHVACSSRHLPLVRACGTPARCWDLDAIEALWMFGGADPVGYGEAVVFAEGRALLPVARCHAVASRPPPGVRAWAHFASVLPSHFPLADPWLRLAAPPIRLDRPIVLAPGASDAGRSWPLSRWQVLRDRLAANHPVVLVGGPLEAWATYRPGLEELCGLAASAGAWLGPDSGPTHLAARFGAPTFVVFPTDDHTWMPAGATAVDWAVADEELVRTLVGVATEPSR
ncbi:MAG: hypothetical protein EXR71_15525 [Myxococcales bacterium]|nr:hypothetical protein [Myxococcales bacterium]